MKNEYVYSFTATSGVKIKDIEYDIVDKVNVTFFYYSELREKVIEEKSRKYKVYTTSKGDYFNFKGIRIYLHDFIRVC